MENVRIMPEEPTPGFEQDAAAKDWVQRGKESAAAGNKDDAREAFQRFLREDGHGADARIEAKDLLAALLGDGARVCDRCYCVSSYRQAFTFAHGLILLCP